MSDKKITILKNGPYIVTGGVPISEKVITPVGNHYVYGEGRPLPQAEIYALCRCGKSTKPPFCRINTSASHLYQTDNGKKPAGKSERKAAGEETAAYKLDISITAGTKSSPALSSKEIEALENQADAAASALKDVVEKLIVGQKSRSSTTGRQSLSRYLRNNVSVSNRGHRVPGVL
ncbi:MAG: hypothetical protein GX936_05875 [Clostridiales bacterium]|jgi:CDGSH-type Zn-finger protein|nr:hypothetical protein [Clostridiales bacterium]